MLYDFQSQISKDHAALPGFLGTSAPGIELAGCEKPKHTESYAGVLVDCAS